MNPQTDRRLRVLLVAGCLLGTAALVGAFLVLRFPAARGFLEDTSGHPGYRVGEKVDLPAAVYDRSKFTVVLFASGGCGACQLGVPFYRRIVELHGLTVVSFDEDDSFRKVLGIDSSHWIRLDRKSYDSMRLSGVPTLLGLNGNGTILLRQVGAIDTNEEGEVLARITAFAK